MKIAKCDTNLKTKDLLFPMKNPQRMQYRLEHRATIFKYWSECKPTISGISTVAIITIKKEPFDRKVSELSLSSNDWNNTEGLQNNIPHYCCHHYLHHYHWMIQHHCYCYHRYKIKICFRITLTCWMITIIKSGIIKMKTLWFLYSMEKWNLKFWKWFTEISIATKNQ